MPSQDARQDRGLRVSGLRGVLRNRVEIERVVGEPSAVSWFSLGGGLVLAHGGLDSGRLDTLRGGLGEVAFSTVAAAASWGRSESPPRRRSYPTQT